MLNYTAHSPNASQCVYCLKINAIQKLLIIRDLCVKEKKIYFFCQKISKKLKKLVNLQRQNKPNLQQQSLYTKKDDYSVILCFLVSRHKISHNLPIY